MYYTCFPFTHATLTVNDYITTYMNSVIEIATEVFIACWISRSAYDCLDVIYQQQAGLVRYLSEQRLEVQGE
jgi:hypothetical protein